MSKYSRGLSMTERSRNSQRTGTTNVMVGSESFLSKTNQILHVFTVEYFVENKRLELIHVRRRAIANTPEEVVLLVRESVRKSTDMRLIEFVGEPVVIGKDRTWLSAGKKTDSTRPRLTDEVVYVEHGVCQTPASS